MEKHKNIIALLAVIIGVVVLASIFIYGNFVYENTTVYFNPRKKDAAEKLYSSIMDEDLENNYPKTPDEVMEINLNIIKMMYGNMIVERELYSELIKQQRKLFGPELNDQNSPEVQLETLLTAVDMLGEQRISHYSFEQLPTIYNTIDADICYVRVEQTFNNNEKYYWEYQLSRQENDRKWKIIRWESTDENYNTDAANAG